MKEGGDVSLYSVEYDGPGVPRVYLNGIGMTVSHWKAFREQMKPGRDVLHDFKDQLRSGKAASAYEMESHAHELAALLDRYGIASAIVIGTSYGAEVGLLFALHYPGRCRGLVLIDGVSESDAVLKAAVESWKYAALSDPRVFYRTLIPWNYSAEFIEQNGWMLSEREASVAQLPREYFEGFARLCDAFLSLDITGELHRIDCPTLILVAEYDILKTERYTRLMYETIPGAEVATVAGAGHAVVIENPVACAQHTQAFIDRIGV